MRGFVAFRWKGLGLLSTEKGKVGVFFSAGSANSLFFLLYATFSFYALFVPLLNQYLQRKQIKL